WPWRFRSDFVFDFLKGPRRGCQISLVAAEMADDKIINIGSPGERVNDIEVSDPNVANNQALLRYRQGRFSLVNAGPPDRVLINRVPMKPGDQVVLMTGDLIEAGETTVRFLERRVVETLSSYLVEVESGVDADQGRTFSFTKQRLLIGRGRNCDIHLSDLEVSRVHACLVFRDGRFYLQHRSETNPTFVNGMSVLPGSERMITPDDRIRLSSLTVLRFVLKGMPPGGPSTAMGTVRGAPRK
ncbi:MAG: FHA domain-containing protein, partial [Candidatus Eremiobacterota bacterium]